MNLIGKNILVTGASSGIGRSTAIMLAQYGANLIICGRNETKLLDLFNLLNDSEKHLMFIGDLNNGDIIDSLVNQLPPLSGIVLSAGIVKTVPFKFLSQNDMSSIMTSNFQSPILLLQKILKKRVLLKMSSVVFVSSIAGNYIADKGNGAYAASKAALNGISKVIAVELAPQKIRVNCVCPGMVRTPMTANELASVTQEQLVLNEKLYPLGYGEPSDVAGAILFLLSDLSKWITGTSLIIDGGFSIV
jgi:NAD(P)-dependent dehydrogenase (short-subunit alcohol dehydrogenase family)